MRVLIIGASGLVGGELYSQAKSYGHKVVGTYLSHPVEGLERLDYGDVFSLDKMLAKFSPEVILIPAAISNVEWCEKKIIESHENNVKKLSDCINFISKTDVSVCFFSTNYLFDGKNGPYSENDTPNPINIYGKHKLMGENIINDLLPNRNYIFRTAQAFGYERQEKNYVYQTINNLSLRKKILTATDLISTPTYVSDIPKFVFKLLNDRRYGTYNLIGDVSISRYDFTVKIAQLFELEDSLIIPVTFNEMKLNAQRPLNSSLLNKKVNEITQLSWTKLEDALYKMKQKINNKD